MKRFTLLGGFGVIFTLRCLPVNYTPDQKGEVVPVISLFVANIERRVKRPFCSFWIIDLVV